MTPVDPGLCATCANARRIDSAHGSTFWRCARADDDPRYRKYPPLPVVACAGHAASADREPDRGTVAPDEPPPGS